MPLPVVNIKGPGKCPKCGSAKKALDQYVEELVTGKYLPKNFLGGNPVKLSVPITDVTNSPLNIQQKIPVLIIDIAVCGEPDCMNIWCDGIVSVEGAAVRQGGPSGPGAPGGMPGAR